MKRFKVAHLTSAHPRYDVRIFHRECCSLAQAGYETHLVVADGEGDTVREGVQLHDVGKSGSRFARIVTAPFRVLVKAYRLKADLYHFHDTELIFAALCLRLFGKQVVFDVHENIPMQILTKPYLPAYAKRPLQAATRLLNRLAAKQFALILAETSYAPMYQDLGARYVVVMNMPDLTFFEPFRVMQRAHNNEIFYIGGVSKVRGLLCILDALMLLRKQGIAFRMHFIGSLYHNEDLSRYASIMDAVEFHGRMELEQGYALSRRCDVGLSIMLPVENYLHSYSTKVFEYMAVGLPVIVSDFALYDDVVKQTGAGLCIDPHSPEALASAIETILIDRQKALRMGEAGVAHAQKTFNWEHERAKLLAFYDDMLKGTS